MGNRARRTSRPGSARRDCFSPGSRTATHTRRRAVVLFTDGRPTHSADEHIARLQALREAGLARGARHRPVRAGDRSDRRRTGATFLLELAGAGQGRVYRVLDPSRLLDDLDPLALAPRWLDIVNTTTQASPPARSALALDGRFDAFVPLAPGTNRIRVIAELGDGKLQRWEKDVHYQPPAVETEAHRRAAARCCGSSSRAPRRPLRRQPSPFPSCTLARTRARTGVRARARAGAGHPPRPLAPGGSGRENGTRSTGRAAPTAAHRPGRHDGDPRHVHRLHRRAGGAAPGACAPTTRSS